MLSKDKYTSCPFQRHLSGALRDRDLVYTHDISLLPLHKTAYIDDNNFVGDVSFGERSLLVL